MTEEDIESELARVTPAQIKALGEEIERMEANHAGDYVNFNQWDRTFFAISQLVTRAWLALDNRIEQYHPDLLGTRYGPLVEAYQKFDKNFLSIPRVWEKNLSGSQLSVIVDGIEQKAREQRIQKQPGLRQSA